MLWDKKPLKLKNSWFKENHSELDTRSGNEWENLEDIRWINDAIEID